MKSVYAHLSTQVHGNRTQGDDEALCIIEFEGGATGVVENSWTKPGGMDDTIEIFGDKGQTYADMLMGNALPTYSEVGFGYAVEKASTTTGWTWPVFEEHWNYGFPQEMRHFARCVRGTGDADIGRRDRSRGAGSAVRCVRFGRAGAQDGVAVPATRDRQADRSLEGSSACGSGRGRLAVDTRRALRACPSQTCAYSRRRRRSASTWRTSCWTRSRRPSATGAAICLGSDRSDATPVYQAMAVSWRVFRSHWRMSHW